MDETNEHKLLINDEDGGELEIADLQTNSEITTIENSNALGPLLNNKLQVTYSTNKILEASLTLRQCNSEYGRFNGSKYSNNSLPEFDRCTTKGCISPLRKFENIIGHFAQYKNENNSLQTRIICLKPEIVTTMKEFAESIRIELGSSIRRGRLWNLQGCDLCSGSKDGKWVYKNENLDVKLSSALNLISISFPTPLSVHTQHAWLECEEAKDINNILGIFKRPEETTAVTGLFGTLQNNQLIDLAQEDSGSTIDVDLRYKDVDIPGFLCSGHTAHSTEAGRVRRVCDRVFVRILNDFMLIQLCRACEISDKYNKDKKEWILFCMGKMVYCTTKSILLLRNFLISCSSSNIHIPTIYINSEAHTAILSISSGVLLKRDINNLVVSTMSSYSDPWPDNRYIPMFPTMNTEEGFKFYFSSFFQLTPYIAFDRPPRTLISSVQSVQVVTTPYGAGTSSVAPNHTSKPLVSTPLIEDLLNSPECKLPDYMPGEDLVVCFANFNDTNEDSIMMSEGSVGRGLFSYLAYSVHVVNSNENIPEVGKYAHIKENRWWKSYSRRQTEPPRSMNGSKKAIPLLAGGDGRGKIISINNTQSGQISVKVLRYSTPASGDKMASGHGQKGVIKLIPEQDMPWGIDENGEVVKFDMIISLSSISNRLTVGQYYEMISGIEAAREGRRLVVSPSQYHDNHSETVLYSGITGELIERTSDNGDIPILATWGISRVWQMTQLTWDKQHYVHNTAGKQSILTGVGRTAGGGIKFGEMETHATDASGLTGPCEELVSRIDLIDTQLCTRCNELTNTCVCEDDRVVTNVSIPYSMMVFADSNLLTSGYVSKFKVSF